MKRQKEYIQLRSHTESDNATSEFHTKNTIQTSETDAGHGCAAYRNRGRNPQGVGDVRHRLQRGIISIPARPASDWIVPVLMIVGRLEAYPTPECINRHWFAVFVSMVVGTYPT